MNSFTVLLISQIFLCEVCLELKIALVDDDDFRSCCLREWALLQHDRIVCHALSM